MVGYRGRKTHGEGIAMLTDADKAGKLLKSCHLLKYSETSGIQTLINLQILKIKKIKDTLYLMQSIKYVSIREQILKFVIYLLQN